MKKGIVRQVGYLQRKSWIFKSYGILYFVTW